ncbi:cutinase family protein [Mycobacterium sp. SMC-4]|uniref:cutinase family protein n=1 Tax=Mycobacterium sp. SMC-4 TaxID=2857059 RepID=UPI0021B467A7|nr:cutinase family protein [Mycobacterium sp. SMC-4]UXA20382.1 cutinase family protein [Mycobacterium sp. SMC-4]
MSAVLAFLAVVQAPTAAAVSCPDVEVVFARGTSSRAGLGTVGKAFVDSLKWKLLGKRVSAYAVNYPASWNFSKSTSDGAVDANKHVQYVAGMCPETKIVLGGMSQGAGVVDLILIGNRRIWFFTPAPLPDSMVNHVAAVAVFGNPARNVPGGGPLTAISPLYGNKSIDLCADGDPYCSRGRNFFAHFAYTHNGMIDEAATFAARRVLGRET